MQNKRRNNPRLYDEEGRLKPEHHGIIEGMETVMALLDEAEKNYFLKLEETKEDFFARTGTADDIDKIIHDRYSLLPSILRNPAFSRKHHEILMNHPDSDFRFYSLVSPHVTDSDLETLSKDPVASVKTSARVKLQTKLDESKEEFLARHGSSMHIHDAIDSGEEPYIRATMKNPAFEREHHDRLMDHENAYMRGLSLYSPHLTTEDLTHIIHDPRNHQHVYILNTAIQDKRTRTEDIKHVANNPKNWDALRANAVTQVHSRGGWSVEELNELAKNSVHTAPKTMNAAVIALNVKPLKESTIPKIQAGISRNEGKPQEPFSCYEWENKLVWVPHENIIADAKETHEGLRHMAEEFVFEDVAVHKWEPQQLATELGLSRSVHQHYAEAGVNHYPYTEHFSSADHDPWPKIKAVQDFNYNSKLTNDFLHRNYHGKNRSWDEQYHQQVPLIDSIFKDTTKAPINTMSGLKHSPQDLIDHVRSKGHEVGDHIYLHLPAYTSTSTRLNTALAFTPMVAKNAEHYDAHMFHIHVPAGNKLIGLETHPDLENGSEHELVLPRDTILRVNTKPNIYQVGQRNVHVWMSHVAGTRPTPLSNVK